MFPWLVRFSGARSITIPLTVILKGACNPLLIVTKFETHAYDGGSIQCMCNKFTVDGLLIIFKRVALAKTASYQHFVGSAFASGTAHSIHPSVVNRHVLSVNRLCIRRRWWMPMHVPFATTSMLS